MKLLNTKMTDRDVRKFALGLVVESLPFRTFDNRRTLPEVPAIYFVMDGGQIIYIGQTENLRQRRASRSVQGTETSITYWVEMESGADYWPIAGMRIRIEKVLIARFRPPLNKRHSPLNRAHISGPYAFHTDTTE